MDRRKGEVFWKVLNLVVNLTFLLLAITIMTILLRNDSQRVNFSEYESSLQNMKQEINNNSQQNFSHLESKVNSVATNQDSYQINTTRRIDVLEGRLQILESTTPSQKTP